MTFCIDSVLKHCAANRKGRLSELPNVGPYIYTTLKFLALQGAPYIYISRLRVNPLKIKIPSKNMREKPTNTPIIHSVS
jgi:hypothetical protein